MSAIKTIEEAKEMIARYQSLYHESENNRITAQAMAFEYLCKETCLPDDISLKAKIVEMKLDRQKLTNQIDKLKNENKNLVEKVGRFKNLEASLVSLNLK